MASPVLTSAKFTSNPRVIVLTFDSIVLEPEGGKASVMSITDGDGYLGYLNYTINGSAVTVFLARAPVGTVHVFTDYGFFVDSDHVYGSEEFDVDVEAADEDSIVLPSATTSAFGAGYETVIVTFSQTITMTGAYPVFSIVNYSPSISVTSWSASGTELTLTVDPPMGPTGDPRVTGVFGSVVGTSGYPCVEFDLTIPYPAVDDSVTGEATLDHHPALSANGSSVPPLFTGSIAAVTRRSLTTAGVSGDGVRHGSLSASVRKTTINGFGQYAYDISGSASLSHSSTMSAEAGNWSPLEFPLAARGTEGSGTVAGFSLFWTPASDSSFEFPVTTPLVVERPTALDFPIHAFSSAALGIDFTVAGRGRSWDPLIGEFPLLLRGSDADAISRTFPVFLRGGSYRPRHDFDVFLKGASSAFSTHEFSLFVHTAGDASTFAFPCLATSRPTAARWFPLFLRGPDGTPGARIASGVFDVSWETGTQFTFPIVCGVAVATSEFPLRTRGAAVSTFETPIHVVGFGGVASLEHPIFARAVDWSTATDMGEFPVVVAHTHGDSLLRFPIFVNGWSPS